ncbi:MAG: hypothetical protein ACP6IP_01785 [Candidatus Njordarchaeia archaeon]
MTKICLELDEYIEKELNLISQEENTSIENIALTLLKRAIKDWKREYALEKLRNGEWTIGKAARFLEISFTEMVRIIEENNLVLGERKVI